MQSHVNVIYVVIDCVFSFAFAEVKQAKPPIHEHSTKIAFLRQIADEEVINITRTLLLYKYTRL